MQREPWTELSTDHLAPELLQMMRAGVRLPAAGVPPSLRVVMEAAWATDPRLRPPFSTLVHHPGLGPDGGDSP